MTKFQMPATEKSFLVFRTIYPLRTLDRSRVGSPDELHQLTTEQGLVEWRDGPLVDGRTARTGVQPGLISSEKLVDCHLWAVRQQDVVFAHENCAFAAQLDRKVVKHSNLTGGGPAHSAGEMLFLALDTIVINGSSGRYGARSPEEIDAVALAFCRSGYDVWSMGWDEDAGWPAPFVGKIPTQVVP